MLKTYKLVFIYFIILIPFYILLTLESHTIEQNILIFENIQGKSDGRLRTKSIIQCYKFEKPGENYKNRIQSIILKMSAYICSISSKNSYRYSHSYFRLL